ncbi:MAG: glycosyltransferase [Alphaproteobacteria bacterium]|nr:glycosyltransferase [Alphaproteobacteria bacterium]
MKFLFVSGFQHLPQAYGGIMANTHEIAVELKQRGHEIVVAANMEPKDRVGFRTRLMGRLVGKKRVSDRLMGYPTYRRWDIRQALEDIVQRECPDVAVVQALYQVELGKILDRLSIPMIVYFHDVLFDLIDGDPSTLRNALFLSNSQFTARAYREKYGLESAVLPPLFRTELYRTATEPAYVTLINPQIFKGSDVALELVARCPDIPFCFVESWRLTVEQEAEMRAHARKFPNLTFRNRTADMKSVYRQTKILLAPSRLEEGWGRVASEAQYSGIPVLASSRGALPEAVGPGGLLLDPDAPIEDWVKALRRLWDDKTHYAALSAAALRHAERADIRTSAQIDTLLALAEKAALLRRSPGASNLAERRTG